MRVAILSDCILKTKEAQGATLSLSMLQETKLFYTRCLWKSLLALLAGVILVVLPDIKQFLLVYYIEDTGQ